MNLHSSRRNLKGLAFIGMFIVFYNEFLVYWISYMSWPALHKQSQFLNPNGSVINDLKQRPLRLLLVADPQLIGENDEHWSIGWLARWDSDRFLRSSFILANAYVRPDAIIYLGDLFDEGLKASAQQYERYYQRFESAFQLDKMARLKPPTKQIFLPGDNDIGGEYMGDRNEQLEDRYEKYFGPMVDVLKLNAQIEFVKLDLDYTVSFYNKVKRGYLLHLLRESENLEKNASMAGDKYTVILNHQTLLRKTKEELNALNEDINAALIIKGDSHRFDITKYSYLVDQVVDYINLKKNPSNYYILNLQANKPNHRIQTVYELSIPTCSYRMGTPNMGYGMLTLSPKGKAYVSILWLPSRYSSLFIYLYFILFVALYMLFAIAFKRAFQYTCRYFFAKLDVMIVNVM